MASALKATREHHSDADTPPRTAYIPGDNRAIGVSRPAVMIRRQLTEAQVMIASRVKQQVQKLLALTEDDPNAPPCPFCTRGMPRPDDVKLRAILALLDRAGLGPKTKIEIEDGRAHDVEWMEYLNEEELLQMKRLVDVARSRRANDIGDPIDVTPVKTENVKR